jgi:hypothetical protein
LDLEKIAFILHPEFKFVYWINYSGNGIRTDIRYIGHLYKTFVSMKKEGLSIKTEFCYLTVDNVKYMGIKLLPPQDMRIILPMYGLYHTISPSFKELLEQTDELLLTKVKNGLLCKIESYAVPEFIRRVGTISPYE